MIRGFGVISSYGEQSQAGITRRFKPGLKNFKADFNNSNRISSRATCMISQFELSKISIKKLASRPSGAEPIFISLASLEESTISWI